MAWHGNYRKQLAVLLAFTFATWGTLSHASLPIELIGMQPDLVKVDKSEKKLFLMHDGKVIKEYPIALGKNPVGHKKQEGDGRTPEGRYTLDWRKSNSRFYRSIHISYPNDLDLQSATDRQKAPGEFIMIHGSPKWVPSSEWAANWLQKDNWTEGCIAVTNEQMDEIWNLVADGTPIEIQP